MHLTFTGSKLHNKISNSGGGLKLEPDRVLCFCLQVDGPMNSLRYCMYDNVQTQTEPPSSPSAVKQKHLYTNRSSGNRRLGSTYCIQM